MALLTSNQIADMNAAFDELHNFIRCYAAGIIDEVHMDMNTHSFTHERIIIAFIEVAKTIEGANTLFNQYVRLGEFMDNPISKKLVDDTLEYLKTDPLVPEESQTDVRTIYDAYCSIVCIITEGIDAYMQRCKENVIFCIDLKKKFHDMRNCTE